MRDCFFLQLELTAIDKFYINNRFIPAAINCSCFQTTDKKMPTYFSFLKDILKVVPFPSVELRTNIFPLW
jgi:hypothetical protein